LLIHGVFATVGRARGRLTRRSGFLSVFFLVIALLGSTPAFTEPPQAESEGAGKEEALRGHVGSQEVAKERWRLRWWDPLPEIGDLSKSWMVDLEEIAATQVSGKPPEEKEEKKGEILIAPIPISNPTIGLGLALVGGYVYPMNKNDKVSPPSFTGGGGMYTDSKSWVVAVAQKAYLSEDRYRILGGIGIGEMNYDFYGVGTDSAKRGKSIPITQEAGGFLVEALRRIVWDSFAGLKYQFIKVRTSVDLSDRFTQIGLQIPRVVFDVRTAVLGLHIQRDTRDSTFYPRKGSLLDLQVDPYSEIWGGDFNYQVYSIAYNKYIGLDDRQVLAFRGYGRFTAGDVPFFHLCLFGTGSDLRGYTGGQYRDRMMLAAQAEYRLELPWRFGLAAFAGVGEVARALDDFNTKDLLPSAGAGVRYTIATKNHINLRLDFAWGKGSNGFYFSVGEAF
jgi:hypothetical protein